jgi:hypothetical protein
MANTNKAREITETPAEATSAPEATGQPEARQKRKLKKNLKLHTPFVKWYVGLIVCGTITRKFRNSGEYGEKSNLELKLLDPCTFTTGDGEVLTLEKDEMLNVSQTAGLGAAMSLDVGATVQIECTGQKDMGKKKNPAWDFVVDYE